MITASQLVLLHHATVFTATVFTLVVAGAVSPAFAESGCKRVRLQEDLSFVGSTAWLTDRSQAGAAPSILVTNPIRRTTTVISEEGTTVDGDLAALAISKIGDDYLRFTGQFYQGQFQIHSSTLVKNVPLVLS